MTNVKSPRVRILIGSVRTIKIGFSTILMTAKKAANQNAVQKLATVTPGTKKPVKIIANEAINHFKINFINLILK